MIVRICVAVRSNCSGFCCQLACDCSLKGRMAHYEYEMLIHASTYHYLDLPTLHCSNANLLV